ELELLRVGLGVDQRLELGLGVGLAAALARLAVREREDEHLRELARGGHQRSVLDRRRSMTCSTQRVSSSSSAARRAAGSWPPPAAGCEGAAPAPPSTLIRMCSSRISMGTAHSTVK